MVAVSELSAAYFSLDLREGPAAQSGHSATPAACSDTAEYVSIDLMTALALTRRAAYLSHPARLLLID